LSPGVRAFFVICMMSGLVILAGFVFGRSDLPFWPASQDAAARVLNAVDQAQFLSTASNLASPSSDMARFFARPEDIPPPRPAAGHSVASVTAQAAEARTLPPSCQNLATDSASTAGSAASMGNSEPPLVIGAILPLSSPGAFDAGFAMQFALNTAAKIVNREGGINGRPIRLVTYDSAGIPRRGALYAERLITMDCAAVIVGLFHDNVAAAVLDVAESHSVPVIIAGARDERLTADQSPVAFRIAPIDAVRDRNLVEFLKNQFSADPAQVWRDGEAAVIYVTENYEIENRHGENVVALMEDAGMTAKALRVDLPITDLSPTLTRILAGKMPPDAIVLDLPALAVDALHARLLDLGIGPATGTLIIADGPEQNDQLAIGSTTGSPVIVGWDGPWPSTVHDAGRPLIADFAGYFDRWPEPIAFQAYDSLLLAVDALRRTETLAGVDIIAALETTDVQLGSGRYHFPYGAGRQPEGAAASPEEWHQWMEPHLLYLQLRPAAKPPSDAQVIWP
jgi:branched-chain amino acid transport system substrate-binding protein